MSNAFANIQTVYKTNYDYSSVNSSIHFISVECKLSNATTTNVTSSTVVFFAKHSLCLFQAFSQDFTKGNNGKPFSHKEKKTFFFRNELMACDILVQSKFCPV